jgi:hypothetical protein
MIYKSIKLLALSTLLFTSSIYSAHANVLLFNKSFYQTAYNANNPVAADSVPINDGPYIFIKENFLIEKSIVDGKVETKKLAIESTTTHFIAEPAIYKKVKKIAALSDIHGQYDIFINILKNNEIINENLEWSFGKGHLVIVGDVFDRGDKVTETLWFIYNLERKAKKRGGRVHFLLGNHEYMVLHNDLRYIHKKYELSSELLKIDYAQLYGNNTVLGRWLRSKPTIIKLNDNLFVHGGISQEFINQGYDLEKTNNLMRESLDRDKEEMKSGQFYQRYYGSNGPIWYRGYFKGAIQDQEISSILAQLNAKHIIVGHNSQVQVLQLFDKKVFAVDSSIKKGETGEILLIRKKLYYRGTMQGEKIIFE